MARKKAAPVLDPPLPRAIWPYNPDWQPLPNFEIDPPRPSHKDIAEYAERTDKKEGEFYPVLTMDSEALKVRRFWLMVTRGSAGTCYYTELRARKDKHGKFHIRPVPIKSRLTLGTYMIDESEGGTEPDYPFLAAQEAGK